MGDRSTEANRRCSATRHLAVRALSAGLLLFSATACGELFGGKPVPQGSADRASPQRIETEQKRAAAKRAIADYEYAQRNELVEDMKAHLADMQVEVDAIEAKLATATGDAKAEIEVKLAALRKRWDASKKELAAVEAAGEADWEIVKARFAKAYDDLDSSVDDARQWVSDRIEP
jgi:hypothetical protein